MRKFGWYLGLWLCLLPLATHAQSVVKQKAHTARFNFEVVGEATGGYANAVSAIRVLDRTTGRLRQTLDGFEAEPKGELAQALGVEDINFDGQPDLILMEFMPLEPNPSYLVWLYQPRTGKFRLARAFSDITALQADARRKVIVSPWRDGCCHHGRATYRVIHNKPVLVEEREIQVISTEDGKTRFRYSYSRRVNGKMRIIKSGYRRKYEL